MTYVSCTGFWSVITNIHFYIDRISLFKTGDKIIQYSNAWHFANQLTFLLRLILQNLRLQRDIFNQIYNMMHPWNIQSFETIDVKIS